MSASDIAKLPAWEDAAQQWEAGPFVITREQLDTFFALTASHTDEHDVVPPMFLQAFASGHAHAVIGYSALIAVRREEYRFVGRLGVGEPFRVEVRVLSAAPVDERLGLLELERRLMTLTGREIATGRVHTLRARRALLSERP